MDVCGNASLPGTISPNQPQSLTNPIGIGCTPWGLPGGTRHEVDQEMAVTSHRGRHAVKILIVSLPRAMFAEQKM